MATESLIKKLAMEFIAYRMFSYNLIDLKSRISRLLLTAGFFSTDFMYGLIVLFFIVPPCLAVAVQPCME